MSESESENLDSSLFNNSVINSVPVKITVVLGGTLMTINQVLKFKRGTIVELNKKVSDPVDLYINDKLIARGEVVVIDQSVGITLTEVIQQH